MHRVKPKPIYRSIIFWSGILVLLFICWAWRDSYYRSPAVSFRVGSVVSGNGGVMIFRTKAPLLVSYQPSPYLRPDWELFQAPFSMRGLGLGTSAEGSELTVKDRELKAARNAREFYDLLMDYRKQSDRLYFIPHWCILLAVALAWSGLLLRRTRRFSRAMKDMAQRVRTG